MQNQIQNNCNCGQKKQQDVPNLGFKQARELLQNYDPNNPKLIDPPKTTSTSPKNEPKNKKPTSNNIKKAPQKQNTSNSSSSSSSRKRTMSTEKSNIVYLVEDQVLLTKDRMGVIKYAGKVQDSGDDIYYGIELTNGVLGNSDGIFKNTRYFQTDGKRAVFVKRDQIRRKMTRKDKRRKDSYDLTKSIKESKTTPIVTPIINKSPKETYELPKNDIKNNTMEKNNVNNNKQEVSNSFTKITRNETIFQYIWRQNEKLRDELLDVYCHPLLNPLLKDSFIELQAVNNNREQGMMWEALMKRWKKHL